MQFVLNGFTHELEFRVFDFDCIGDDRVRTKCTVRADLALARRYGIQIQDLPLMCSNLLDGVVAGGELGALTLTEDAMRACADERAAARDLRASKRKQPQKPAADNLGAAWRGQHFGVVR